MNEHIDIEVKPCKRYGARENHGTGIGAVQG